MSKFEYCYIVVNKALSGNPLANTLFRIIEYSKIAFYSSLYKAISFIIPKIVLTSSLIYFLL